ncbi:MAG: UvrD-helicase domain-containing protein [Bacteroidales bacterium]|nr:UvrD-helicase domain-containing protein [Bacteroidales bacterium]
MLNIYKASAGAGKTYTLTLEYIKLLFSDPNNFRKTLAVTFTNNACGEMKNRILNALYNLSFNDKADYVKELTELGYSKKEIQEKSFLLFKNILHNYSFFYIETIDAFTQKVLRNFAKDLGLPPKFNLEISQDEILETITKNLLVNSIENEELHKTLIEFAFNDIEENKNTDIKAEIKNESNVFFSELYQEYAKTDSSNNSEQIDSEKLQSFFLSLEKQIEDYKQTTSSKAAKAFDLITKAGLSVEDFKGKSRSQLTPLKKIKDKDFSKSLNEKVCDINEVLSPQKALEIHSLYTNEFIELLQEIVNLTDRNSQEYSQMRTAEELLKHKKGIILSQYIHKELDDYCKQENTFFIAFANKFLKTIINGSDTPFVYEKIGQTIENIMIDEFQDTSKMQWENFKPIVFNLLSMLKDALIIGDVKQSIYRFRNGDWKLLHSLDKDTDLQHYAEQKTISDNHRSLKNIVEFNNEFFKKYATYVDNTFNKNNNTSFQTISDIYKDCEQGVAKGDGGCIEIQIINSSLDLNAEVANEQLLESIFEKTVSLLRNGRKADDIVFLCYKNKQIAELVDFFNKKKKDPQYSDIKDSFSIMSKEALLINNSIAVQFITSYLQKLTTPENSNESKFLDAFLTFAYQNIHKTTDELPNVEISRNMSIFETCESIIEKFKLASESETPYITDFQNLVYSYSKSNTTSLSHFLEHWNEIKDKNYLQQAKTTGCMSASTVHNSKGLEYPVVIMPRLLKTSPSNRSALYQTNFDELPIAKLSGNLSDTTLKDKYIEELYNTEIDNINALYVACTRPKEELYIFDKCSTKSKNILKVFEETLSQIHNAEITEYNLSIGKPSGSKNKEAQKDKNKPKATIIKNYPLTSNKGENSNIKLLADKNSKDFLELFDTHDTKRRHGLLMHKILEHIETASDIEKYVNLYCTPDLFSTTEKKSLTKTLKERIANNKVSHWFDDSWDYVLTEQSILTKDIDIKNGQKERRPDRMLIKGKDVTIIDYKFTNEEHDSHINQVREYMNILSRMGYNPEGFVWYVELDKIKEV